MKCGKKLNLRKERIMKNLLIFCIICLTGQPLIACNTKLLDLRAEPLALSIRTEEPLHSKDIMLLDLSFLPKNDKKLEELLAKYEKKPTFNSKEGPNDPKLKEFYQLCRDIYMENKSITDENEVPVFPITLVTLQILYERVAEMHENFKKLSARPAQTQGNPLLNQESAEGTCGIVPPTCKTPLAMQQPFNNEGLHLVPQH